MSQSSLWRALAVAVCCSTLTACGGEEAGGNAAANASNQGGKADSSEDWVSSALGERDDPIARYLRTIAGVDDNGEFFGRYQTVQAGLAEAQGCSPSASSNYIISDALISDEPFPRLVSTVCSGDPAKNWQVFMSPPSSHERDIDVHTIEMFAWDANTRRYNFYKTFPVVRDSDRVVVEVAPAECSECHLGPEGLDTAHMPMLPIMNELTQPWEHWNATPGFESHEFSIPEDVENAPEYADLTGGNWKASASTLEQVIRSGHQQVAEARVLSRRDAAPANVGATMGLLRPFFCDEQVNYVSEAGTSGQILLESVIDRGLTDLVKAVEPVGWGQKWMGTESVLRMPGPEGDDPVITMLPVRGNANRVYERLMVSARRAVEPQAAIQVRLFDWQTPAMSELRCNLWRDANLRLSRQPLELDTSEMRNYDLLPILMAEILQVDGTSLVPDGDGLYYMVEDEGAWSDFLAAAATGDVPTAACDAGVCTCASGYCVADLTTMVDVVEDYVTTFEEQSDIRATMWEERQERTCLASACYPNQPFIPDLESCGPCPLASVAGAN